MSKCSCSGCSGSCSVAGSCERCCGLACSGEFEGKTDFQVKTDLEVKRALLFVECRCYSRLYFKKVILPLRLKE